MVRRYYAGLAWPIYPVDTPVELGGVTFITRISHIPTLKIESRFPQKQRDGEWRFHYPGVYAIQNSLGLEEIILVYGHDLLRNSDLVWDFVMRILREFEVSNVINNEGEDLYSDIVKGTYRFLKQPRLHTLNCGPQAHIMCQLLHVMGVKSRVAQWGGDPRMAHQNLEVNIPDRGGWTLYDSQLGLAFHPGCSGLEAWQQISDEKGISSMVKSRGFRTRQWKDPTSMLEQYRLGFGLYVTPEAIPAVAPTRISTKTIEKIFGTPTSLKPISEFERTLYIEGG